MAVSTKDRERLNGEQQSAVQSYTDEYYEAKARGDKAGMQAAHDAAERVRSQAGYSGGADGSAGSAPSRTAEQAEQSVQRSSVTSARSPRSSTASARPINLPSSISTA